MDKFSGVRRVDQDGELDIQEKAGKGVDWDIDIPLVLKE
jgi:hypothetical protein